MGTDPRLNYDATRERRHTIERRIDKDGVKRIHRESVVIINDTLGAVEAWRTQVDDHTFFGGLEIHSPRPLEHDSDEPSLDDCWLIGTCWSSGSGSAFEGAGLNAAFREGRYDDIDEIMHNTMNFLESQYRTHIEQENN